MEFLENKNKGKEELIEQIQENLVGFCEGLPDELITRLHQTVIDYFKEN